MDAVDVNDPTTRAALEAARAWGVPWRTFLGWSPTTTTVHEYDAAGRLVRSVTTTEPLWADEDRFAAMALAEYEAGLCPGCHHDLAETTKRENEFEYRGDPPTRCHRCTALAQLGRKYEELPDPSALLLTVHLREHQQESIPT